MQTEYSFVGIAKAIGACFIAPVAGIIYLVLIILAFITGIILLLLTLLSRAVTFLEVLVIGLFDDTGTEVFDAHVAAQEDSNNFLEAIHSMGKRHEEEA